MPESAINEQRKRMETLTAAQRLQQGDRRQETPPPTSIPEKPGLDPDLHIKIAKEFDANKPADVEKLQRDVTEILTKALKKKLEDLLREGLKLPPTMDQESLYVALVQQRPFLVDQATLIRQAADELFARLQLPPDRISDLPMRQIAGNLKSQLKISIEQSQDSRANIKLREAVFVSLEAGRKQVTNEFISKLAEKVWKQDVDFQHHTSAAELTSQLPQIEGPIHVLEVREEVIPLTEAEKRSMMRGMSTAVYDLLGWKEQPKTRKREVNEIVYGNITERVRQRLDNWAREKMVGMKDEDATAFGKSYADQFEANRGSTFEVAYLPQYFEKLQEAQRTVEKSKERMDALKLVDAVEKTLRDLFENDSLRAICQEAANTSDSSSAEIIKLCEEIHNRFGPRIAAPEVRNLITGKYKAILTSPKFWELVAKAVPTNGSSNINGLRNLASTGALASAVEQMIAEPVTNQELEKVANARKLINTCKNEILTLLQEASGLKELYPTASAFRDWDAIRAKSKELTGSQNKLEHDYENLEKVVDQLMSQIMRMRSVLYKNVPVEDENLVREVLLKAPEPKKTLPPLQFRSPVSQAR